MKGRHSSFSLLAITAAATFSNASGVVGKTAPVAWQDDQDAEGISLIQSGSTQKGVTGSAKRKHAASSYRKTLLESCSSHCIPAVFVVGTGRSGSTTLMHMLNLIPGYDIKGENNGMWGSLYELAQARMKKKKEKNAGLAGTFSRGSSSSDDHPEPNLSDLTCALQLRVLGEINPDPFARVTGFKEIRWNFDTGLDDLDMLMKVFPCSKAVLNFRDDGDAQEESMSKTRGVFDSLDGVGTQKATQALREFYERRKLQNRTFQMPLEKFSVGKFNELLQFLGEDLRCRFVDVLHDNDGAGYTYRTSHGGSAEEAITCF